MVKEKESAIIDGGDCGYIVKSHGTVGKVILSLIWPITFVGFVIYIFIDSIIC